MRVVAGDFKGHPLRAPRGGVARPTADRVREALFSMLGDLGGAIVLDLFAGSGALGIEALSRGAATAVFVDRDPRAVAAIRRNLQSVRADGEVRRQDALRFLASRGGSFDLVLIDPPYDFAASLAGPLAELLPAVLANNAVVVTESDKRSPLEMPLPLTRERTYGDVRIAVHRA